MTRQMKKIAAITALRLGSRLIAFGMTTEAG
jgi:hypothetical protein